MENGQLTWITNFIWGIADDVLRDLYVRGKYRDVILPMTVIRRLDAVLEPTKQAVLDMKASLDKAGIVHQDAALRQAAGQAFYNTSPFTLRDLKARASRQQLEADFRTYLDGFSPNVQEIIDNDASAKLNELRPKFYDPQRPPAASKAQVFGVGVANRSLTLDMIAVPNEPAPVERK
jgi:type I restriction-modification system DNA methylase subunit